MATPDDPPPLDKARHIKYWQRCLKTLLPTGYTAHDSTRMTLGFFILSALDLLGHPLDVAEKRRIRKYVLSLQHPGGGFVGSPNHQFPMRCYLSSSPEGEGEGKGKRHGEEANLAATYFALLILGIVSEEGEEENGFRGVDRRGLVKWLKGLQRGDGSFGEVRDGEEVKGGRDVRYCYLAAAVRWMVMGDEEEEGEDVDVDGLVGYIRRAQTYDGGISESSDHESHAGYAYCAVAALRLLERPVSERVTPRKVLEKGIPDVPALIKFLAHRQIAYIESQEEDEDEEEEELMLSVKEMALEENTRFVGYNGRCNKVADTCYCWWVGGTLDLLNQRNLVAKPASRRFLMAKTQHIIGGFSKYPGGPPDIYHACLGLAALSVLGAEKDGLKELDSGLCVSRDVVSKVERARKGLVARERGGRMQS